MISTRHIRKDWPEWVDWQNQKTVSTMCGVRSQPHLCGIPGITEQDPIVERSGVKAWGWCGRCVKATWNYYKPPALLPHLTDPAIIALHRKAQEALVMQYERILIDRWKQEFRVNRLGNAQALQRMIDDLVDEFRDVLTDTTVS